MKNSLRPRKSNTIPVNKALLNATAREIKSEITSVILAVKSVDQKISSLDHKIESANQKISSLDHKIESVDKKVDAFKDEMNSRFSLVDAQFSSMDSKFEKLMAVVHRTNAIVEEQNAKNQFVLDGYASLYAIQKDLDQRLRLIEKKAIGE